MQTRRRHADTYIASQRSRSESGVLSWPGARLLAEIHRAARRAAATHQYQVDDGRHTSMAFVPGALAHLEPPRMVPFPSCQQRPEEKGRRRSHRRVAVGGRPYCLRAGLARPTRWAKLSGQKRAVADPWLWSSLVSGPLGARLPWTRYTSTFHDSLSTCRLDWPTHARIQLHRATPRVARRHVDPRNTLCPTRP